MTAHDEVRVHGPATAEEVAAVVAVLAAASGAGDEAPEPRGSRWAAHDVRLHRGLRHGPDGWRSTYRR